MRDVLVEEQLLDEQLAIEQVRERLTHADVVERRLAAC